MAAPEDVVISGMSGRFPDCDNVHEFKENLYNKVDMMTSDLGSRWQLEHPEMPKRGGLLRNLTKFDASFFAVHHLQAHNMDPMSRMILELAYEAIVDAGINPTSLRGTNAGVFVGACYSESEKVYIYERIQSHGFGVVGCSRALIANRISYWLDIHGPSYSVDSACSSSMYALDHALRAMRTGQCEAALVGGVNLTLHPYLTMQFARLGVLSLDGKCKSFDDTANGYTRSEAIGMVFLQKAKDAKRIYATVVHTKANQDGYKEQGITFPSGHMQYELLTQCYKECGITPSDIKFVEAHGTGTNVGDPQELNSLDRVFCSNRSEPLLVGSVKSSIGHSEPASGVSAIIKVLLAMENDLISPNLHYKTPRKDVPALLEGRIRVVSEVSPWEGGLAGVSSFGFGGGNAHAVLRSNPKKKPSTDPCISDGLPRLVVVSGRTEEAVETILNELETRPIDSEFIALLLNVHAHQNIPGHIYRGFTVLNASDEPRDTRIRDNQHFPGVKRPIWFVFAGMGSQWPGMGRDLLKLPTFARAIDRCDAILRPLGLNIRHIITEEDPKIFDNILHAFVGIAAVQVGLVDILLEIGIRPDGIVGHSVGELGCAYADGCFTAEQMVMAAYSRGKASLETTLIHGAMAAVGMSHEELLPQCPKDIEIACHNGSNSSTISGPAESVTQFVHELKARGVFAREVPCSNIAYHSRYISEAGPKLLKYLKEVIPNPCKRSERWISSSVPKDLWGDRDALFSSAQYHTNNLLRPVLFAEAIQYIPNDAITVEIAPHGLLQAILRRSLPGECTNISLTQRGTENALKVLFAAFGKMYVTGKQPDVTCLHPPVTYPVSRGTPMISPLIRWQHNDDWQVPNFGHEEEANGVRTISMNVKEKENDFYKGHVINGRNLFPATGYLVLVWETLASMANKLYKDLPIVFKNVKFLRTTYLPKEGFVDFTIMIMKESGNFEVTEGGTAVASGSAQISEDIEMEMLNLKPVSRASNTSSTSLCASDVYKELRLRGYNYFSEFQAVKHINVEITDGEIAWENNWISFMDAMLQAEILKVDSRSLYVPTAIQKLVINVKRHAEILATHDGKSVPVALHSYQEAIAAGGVQIVGLRASLIARRKKLAETVMESYSPLKYFNDTPVSLSTALRAMVHIVLENLPLGKMNIVEWVSSLEENLEQLLCPNIPNILNEHNFGKADINVVGAGLELTEKLSKSGQQLNVQNHLTLANVDLALYGDDSSMLAMNNVSVDAVRSVCVGGFVIVRSDSENNGDVLRFLQEVGLKLVSKMQVVNAINSDHENKCENSEMTFLLLARKVEEQAGTNVVIQVNEESNLVPEFCWLSQLQDVLTANIAPERIYLVSQYSSCTGLLGLVNCLRMETHYNIRAVLILDESAPQFNVMDPFYKSQLQHDLLMNVLMPNGRGWASYRHLPITPIAAKVTHAFVEQMVRGDLSSFRWCQGPLSSRTETTMGDQLQLYSIYAASLNFRDVMIATGKLTTEVATSSRFTESSWLGLEFAGRDPTGKRVMGIVNSGAQANLVQADPLLVWELPTEWTLEAAATVPVVYCTAYYALVVRGQMRNGESVLIHSGTGGVGQAAVNIALYLGCTVYVTVGSAEKRSFLHKMFPQIPDANIGTSRDTSFEQLVKERTKGKGVDLVLNSLAGDKLQASLRCLKMHGRFLEIGKVDINADSPLGMIIFQKDIAIHGVLLDAIIDGTSGEKRNLHDILSQGIKSGAVKPLARQVFGVNEIEGAYRFMASGNHIGKILIRIREEERNELVCPEQRLVDAVSRFYCDPHKSYVIVGGLGGFGLELADWLVLRGARKLVLSTRSGVTNGYQAFRLRVWDNYGVSVKISQADVTCEQGCINLLESAVTMLGPVDAIFNLAVVLRDAIFENQNLESFTVSFMPKARATHLLDEVSRRLCPTLRQFVVFSSVCCGHGNAGQTNYGVANSVMERICEKRRLQGFPALAVQWGAVGDVGLLVKQGKTAEEPLQVAGTLQQSISSCLETLDLFLTMADSYTVLSSMVVAEKDRSSDNVLDAVANILGIKDVKTVSHHSTLAELGMDSMMAVEIKQTLEREFQMVFSPQDIRALTFAKLEEHEKQN